ncbi:hypothetical protein CR513_54066, partial [Mucuna pruriens]
MTLALETEIGVLESFLVWRQDMEYESESMHGRSYLELHTSKLDNLGGFGKIKQRSTSSPFLVQPRLISLGGKGNTWKDGGGRSGPSGRLARAMR